MPYPSIGCGVFVPNEMWSSIQEWLGANEQLAVSMLILSALTFFGSLIAVPILVIRMRADFFTRPIDQGVPLKPSRFVLRIGKNVLGVLLVLAGLAMLILPGQGLLTLLIGTSLLDFPGKRSLQLKMLSLRAVWESVSWIRKKAGKPPLELPDQ